MINRFLIVHTWGIGDLLMFTPALQLLMNELPKTRFDFLVGQPSTAEIIKYCERVENVYYLGKPKTLFKQIMTLRKKKYDCVLVTSGVNPWKSGLLVWAIGSANRVGDYSRNPNPLFTVSVRREETAHMVDNNIKIVLSILKKACHYEFQPKFWFNEMARDKASYILEKMRIKDKLIIGIHCGSGGLQDYKRWPLDYFKEMVKKIIDVRTDVFFLIFAGPSEQELAMKLQNEITHKCEVIEGKPLEVTAALIEKCSLLVSNDSGLGHIASAVNTPVISIFGPTDFAKTGPYGQKCIAIRAKTQCVPCYPQVPIKCKNQVPRCLNELLPSVVVENILQVLGGGKNCEEV